MPSIYLLAKAPKNQPLTPSFQVLNRPQRNFQANPLFSNTLDLDPAKTISHKNKNLPLRKWREVKQQFYCAEVLIFVNIRFDKWKYCG